MMPSAKTSETINHRPVLTIVACGSVGVEIRVCHFRRITIFQHDGATGGTAVELA